MTPEEEARALHDRHPELRVVFGAVWDYQDRVRGEPTPIGEMRDDFGRLVIAAELYGVPCIRAATEWAMQEGRCDVDSILRYAELLKLRY